MTLDTLPTSVTSFDQRDFDNSFSKGFYILDFGLYPDAITADYKYTIQFKPNIDDNSKDVISYSISTVRLVERTTDDINEEIEGLQLGKMMLSRHLFNTGTTGGFIPRKFQKILKSPNEIGTFYQTMEAIKQQEVFKNEVARIIAIID